MLMVAHELTGLTLLAAYKFGLVFFFFAYGHIYGKRLPLATRDFVKSPNQRGLIFLLSDTKFLNTCSFTIHVKNISACSKVLVER